MNYILYLVHTGTGAYTQPGNTAAFVHMGTGVLTITGICTLGESRRYVRPNSLAAG